MWDILCYFAALFVARDDKIVDKKCIVLASTTTQILLCVYSIPVDQTGVEPYIVSSSNPPPPQLLSNLGQLPSSPPVFSPPAVSPVSLVDSLGEFKPYIKFNNFPDELFMKWLKTELKLPQEIAVETE